MKAIATLSVFLFIAVLCPSTLWASNPAVQITWPGSYGRGSVQLSLTASDGTTSTNYTKSVPYGEYSTAASIAAALGAHISMSPEWPVWAKGFPNGSVQMVPRSAVTISNLQVCVVPSGSGGCSSPSGVTIATGDVLPYGPTLVDALYGFVINKPDGSNGYDDAGNVVAYQDLVNQQWGATYDPLNRLKSASQTILSSAGSTFQTPVSTSGTQQYFCWNYDSFGNRTAQIVSDITLSDNSTCQLQPSANHNDSVATYDANNRISSGTGMTSVSYDAMGNLQDDGHYAYKYDGGGRLCAVLKYVTGLVTGYLYDAEGTRVAKGYVSSFDCPTASNFTMTNQYIPGPGGEQMTELDASGNWVHTNIFGNGSLVATEDNIGRHYQLNDWLGNRRMQVDPNGNIETSLQASPYGDALNPPVPISTEQYLTGKERDAESGLDYFGSRYYSSTGGRWMAPDPTQLWYADETNPQSVNLYNYALNNPHRYVDKDGNELLLAGIGAGVGFITGFIGEWIHDDLSGKGFSWRDSLSYGAGGAASGALAGLTFGGSLLFQASAAVAVSTAGGVGGGIISRGLAGEDVFDGDTILDDAEIGFVGGAIGESIGGGWKMINAKAMPKAPTPFAASTFRRLARIRAWEAATKRTETQASVASAVLGSLHSNLGMQAYSGLNSIPSNNGADKFEWFNIMYRPQSLPPTNLGCTLTVTSTGTTTGSCNW